MTMTVFSITIIIIAIIITSIIFGLRLSGLELGASALGLRVRGFVCKIRAQGLTRLYTTEGLRPKVCGQACCFSVGFPGL